MTGLGMCLPGIAGLEVTLRGEDWVFLVRRTDLATDAAFADFHGKEVHARELVRFLPNWESLAWSPAPDNLLSRSESQGTDSVYQVSVSARPASRKTHRDVIEAFHRFMAHSKR